MEMALVFASILVLGIALFLSNRFLFESYILTILACVFLGALSMMTKEFFLTAILGGLAGVHVYLAIRERVENRLQASQPS